MPKPLRLSERPYKVKSRIFEYFFPGTSIFLILHNLVLNRSHYQIINLYYLLLLLLPELSRIATAWTVNLSSARHNTTRYSTLTSRALRLAQKALWSNRDVRGDREQGRIYLYSSTHESQMSERNLNFSFLIHTQPPARPINIIHLTSLFLSSTCRMQSSSYANQSLIFESSLKTTQSAGWQYKTHLLWYEGTWIERVPRMIG